MNLDFVKSARRRACAVLGAATAAVCAAAPAAAAPLQYDISQKTATIAFHTHVARVVAIDGTFQRFSGRIFLDPAQPSALRIAVTVDDGAIAVPYGGAATLRSSAYFDAAQFPTILFRSDGVQVLPGSRFTILGQLTMRDRVQPAVLTGTILHDVQDGTPVLRITARTALNRTGFGMVADRPLIADEVTLTITATLRAP
ncbi:YceI family protein [Acidisoma sp. 7E03]